MKIGDFGAANQKSNLFDTQIGTTPYMAPEILQGKMYDNKVDVWSLGINLYQMCGLKFPFEGNKNVYVYNVLNKEFTPLPPSFPPYLNSLIASMLVKDSKKRFSITDIFQNNSYLSIYAIKLLLTEYDKNKNNGLISENRALVEQNIKLSDQINVMHKDKDLIEKTVIINNVDNRNKKIICINILDFRFINGFCNKSYKCKFFFIFTKYIFLMIS